MYNLTFLIIINLITMYLMFIAIKNAGEVSVVVVGVVFMNIADRLPLQAIFVLKVDVNINPETCVLICIDIKICIHIINHTINTITSIYL